MATSHAIPDSRIVLEYAISQDLDQHVEDDLMVNAIRDGHLVQLPWSQLRPDEQRAARERMFHLDEWEG